MKSDKNNSDNLEILQLEGCFPDYPNLLSEVSDFADTICRSSGNVSLHDRKNGPEDRFPQLQIL